MDKGKGTDYLSLSMLAFAGIGLEALLAFLIEPLIYKTQMKEWSVGQNILHWCITCLLWGIVAVLLIRFSKNKYNFDIFHKAEKMKLWQWILVGISLVFMLTVSYIDWNGFKVAKEFISNGWLKFIFQYIYYAFETALFILIIVFGQKAFEKWFNNPNIPYGGIIVALTWGIAHIFTKSDLIAGVLSAISGFIFGAVYLLVKRDIKKTFIIVFLMFVL